MPLMSKLDNPLFCPVNYQYKWIQNLQYSDKVSQTCHIIIKCWVFLTEIERIVNLRILKGSEDGSKACTRSLLGDNSCLSEKGP